MGKSTTLNAKKMRCGNLNIRLNALNYWHNQALYFASKITVQVRETCDIFCANAVQNTVSPEWYNLEYNLITDRFASTSRLFP